jgi:integration host factor subunit alpha
LRKTATKRDLVDAVFDQIDGLERKEAAAVVDAVFESIKETLERGETVKLSTFGIFTPRDKKERLGRNPQTGERQVVSARRVVVFRVSKVLREALNR